MRVFGWPDDPEESTRRGVRIFDRVAPRYDVMRRLMSGGREDEWKRRSLLGELATTRPRRCLDVASGTGDVATLLLSHFPDASVVALDGNRAMIEHARPKLDGARTSWILADMNRLPVDGAHFDVVTVAYGLRYVTDLPAFLASCHGALRPGGLFWSFDLGVPQSGLLHSAWRAYLFVAGTLLGLVLHARPATYWHLLETLGKYPGQRRVAALLREAGFGEVRCDDLLGGVLAIHVARR